MFDLVHWKEWRFFLAPKIGDIRSDKFTFARAEKYDIPIGLPQEMQDEDSSSRGR